MTAKLRANQNYPQHLLKSVDIYYESLPLELNRAVLQRTKWHHYLSNQDQTAAEICTPWINHIRY